MIEKFEFSKKARTTIIATGLAGLLMVIVGIFIHGGLNTRFWANFLLGNFFFTAISVTALAWMGITYVSNAGWNTALKRINEAITGYLPIGAIAMLILVLASFIDHHSGLYAIYEWLHLDKEGYLVHANGHKTYDEILVGKSGYMNMGFFLIRMAVYFGIWIIFRRMLRNFSLREDANGGLLNYNKSLKASAAFVPLYALSFCLACYDWTMSIEPHWYSTIYAINIFAGALVGSFIITAMIAVMLKRNGYMEYVNDSHFHDLGKFIFGFSIFWTYTWVSQFLLIWYANLPEETVYYLRRMQGGWFYLFFANFAINFVVPLLALMTRNSKRDSKFLITVGGIMIIGRFIDFYLLIMPGSAGENSGFGFYEIGFFLLFGGIFAYIVGLNLAKANLVPVNHPYLEESLHHDI